jgi:hypothetical protein
LAILQIPTQQDTKSSQYGPHDRYCHGHPGFQCFDDWCSELRLRLQWLRCTTIMSTLDIPPLTYPAGSDFLPCVYVSPAASGVEDNPDRPRPLFSIRTTRSQLRLTLHIFTSLAHQPTLTPTHSTVSLPTANGTALPRGKIPSQARSVLNMPRSLPPAKRRLVRREEFADLPDL